MNAFKWEEKGKREDVHPGLGGNLNQVVQSGSQVYLPQHHTTIIDNVLLRILGACTGKQHA